ncbi:MAG TPA: PilZ domain-containing protein [Myxococcales bacterium]|nr:PilZ domain-containing protein [Myxococcales bacterium]
MRKPLVFPVRFVAEGQTVQTTSRDLDEESVFVRCVEPPEVGDRVVLRLYLPGIAVGDSIDATVEEAASEGFRARFDHLSDDAREHLRNALAPGGKESYAPPAEWAHEGENRRLLPRYLDRFRVTLSVGKHKALREALNVSASGMFIESDTPPDVDQIVQVILELPDGKPPPEAQALVLHRVLPGHGTPGAGVQFIEANDDFRVRLDAYLDKLKNR